MRTRSPFPGMDPWLESYWGGVHHTLISSLRRQAFSQLPAGLYADIEENVYVIDGEPDRQLYRPDVAVFDSEVEVRVARRDGNTRGVAVAEPIRLIFQAEPITEGRIEIRDVRNDNRLVTVIEVLSSTNKIDLRGRAAYVAKRAAYIASNVNIVELDLLRAGDHLIGVPIEYLDPPLVVPYKCAIRRTSNDDLRARVDYFPFELREPLPWIPVPLRLTDADILLNLQEPIDTAFDEGGFALRIDYSKSPVPPLSTEDAAWAAQLITISA